MKPTPLSYLLQNVEFDFISGGKDYEVYVVKGVSTDSRTISRGEFFIAIKGDRFDGHDFVEDVIKKGAAGVIIERAAINGFRHLKQVNVPVIAVDNSRRVLGDIARNYLRQFDVRKFVVTGTAGKTTCKSLIGAILSECWNVVTSEKSFNNDIGVPKTILRVGDETDFLIQEIGTNSPGEISYLSGIIGQRYALITNIGPAHVGFFGSVYKIAEEKRAAVEILPEDGGAFLNAEDDYFEFLRSGTKAEVKSFGINKGNVSVASIESMDLLGTQFRVDNERYFTGLTGYHGLSNALAGILVGRYFGIPEKIIRDVLGNLKPEEGRGAVEIVNDIIILDESYNANPLSVKRCLDFFDRIKVEGKKIFVFSDMLELGEQSPEYHREIGRIISQSSVDVLLTFGEMAELVADECRKADNILVESFSDIDRLSERLASLARAGDAMLLKGSRAMALERVKKNFSNLLVLNER